MREKIKEILEQIETVIVGKNDVMERILMAILAGGHVLMEDVPGVGKTTTAMTFARVLGLETRRVQFTSDTMPSDIIGFSVYDKASGKLIYKPGAVMTNLLLADEINRTSSKTQSALLEAMEEGHVSIDGQTHPLPHPFIVLATQNPAGSAGTQLLPNSQLDRFLVKLTIGYPDLRSQVSILEERHTENPLDRVHAVVSAENLKNLKQEAAAVEMKTVVYEYVAQLAEATRNHAMIQLGLSPRGALAVCRMAKAHAYVQGRDYAMPEDVAAIFPDVCCHRLLLNTKARMMERSPEQIVQEVLDSVEMPVIRGSGHDRAPDRIRAPASGRAGSGSVLRQRMDAGADAPACADAAWLYPAASLGSETDPAAVGRAGQSRKRRNGDSPCPDRK